MMTSCTRGSFRQTIRLAKDVSVLNVLISYASCKMEMAALISLYKSTIVVSFIRYYTALEETFQTAGMH